MRLAQLVLALSAIAFVVVLVVSMRVRVDADVHDHYMAALQRLQSLDARVNETVLRGRLGITRSFDPLATMMRDTSAVHVELATVPSFVSSDDRAAVLVSIRESSTFQKARQRNVERFEAEDAALAASIHILAPETTALADRVDGVGGRVLADATRTLRVELLEFAAAREAGHIAAIDAAISSLRAESARWPNENDRASAELLISHVTKVTQRRLRVDALTREIVTEEAMNRALAIESAYTRGVDASRDTWARCVLAMSGLAIAMLMSASAYVVSRLRASAADLRTASSRLSSALFLLQEERAEEKALVELKNRFVAMTSHEFRTPLSVISSSAELLQHYSERWTQEKRGEHLERIRRSVTTMTAMLDRVLLIKKAEAGMLEFRPAVVALDRLLVEIALAIEQHKGTQRRIALDIDPSVGSCLADEQLVRHMIENLLSNALKYSPESEPVHLRASRDQDDLLIAVQDHGIGIPEPDRPRLFDGFHRAPNALHISGTGLGLAVVKRAAELHGGGIEFTSEIGQGTTFVARIRAEKRPE